jgi:glutamate--cysteine ligase
MFDRCAIAVRYVVGGFYRFHRGRGTNENLNARGMQSVSLAFEDICLLPNRVARPGGMSNLFQVYRVIARLALLAAAHELEKSLLPASAINQ